MAGVYSNRFSRGRLGGSISSKKKVTAQVWVVTDSATRDRLAESLIYPQINADQEKVDGYHRRSDRQIL